MPLSLFLLCKRSGPCHAAYAIFPSVVFLQNSSVYTGQLNTLIDVRGNDLCVVLVAVFIHIRYDTWHMIHQQSTMTFYRSGERWFR